MMECSTERTSQGWRHPERSRLSNGAKDLARVAIDVERFTENGGFPLR